jgi:hypothetical protein
MEALMTRFRLRFYADVDLRHETRPSRFRNVTFETAEEAETAARQAMPDIRSRFGPLAGYAVVATEADGSPAPGGPSR